MVKLSPEQVRVFDQVMQWFKSGEKTFVLAGYAGAGKTTLAKYIAKNIDKVHFCAYTGKAANVLRDKGCRKATTIHGAIYTLIDEDGEEPRFALDEDSKIKKCDLVIVDEYSMLSNEIIQDLESLARRVLYLGDPFQLPPVEGLCHLEPDTFITEVHRQALDSPIIRYATDVRNGLSIPYCDDGQFSFQPRKKVAPDTYYDVDQVIVGYNKTRHAWNDRFREKFGFSGSFPKKSEKLICLKNNHEKGLFNGMIDIAKKDALPISGDAIELHFGEFSGMEASAYDFRREKHPHWLRGIERFDYAYAITCHKSQGSEFDSILVYNEPIGRTSRDRQRWLYTAITRAKNKCTLVDRVK